MGLITVNYDKFYATAVENPDVIKKPEDLYDDVFEDRIGTLPGEPISLYCEESWRKCLTAVVPKVEKSTDWVNHMEVMAKKLADLCICLDVRLLNDVLIVACTHRGGVKLPDHFHY